MILPSKEFWNVFKNTEGAFSCAEAIALMNICSQVLEGDYLELGTHNGKSAMSAVIGLKFGSFRLVDPIFEDVKIANETQARVVRSLESTINVHVEANTSLNVLARDTSWSFCFVDSGIHDDMVMEEVKLLEDKMILDGIIAFHDYLNQFTAVERAYNYLLSTGKYEKIEIEWQPIFDYGKEHNLEEGNKSWHQYPDLPHPPNFVGAVKRIK